VSRRDRFQSGSAPSKYICRGMQTAASRAADLGRYEFSLDAPRRTVLLKIRLFGAGTLNFEYVEPVSRHDRFGSGSTPAKYIFRGSRTAATQAVDLERHGFSVDGPLPMTTWHNLTSPSEWSPAGNLEPYLDGCSTPCSLGSKLLAVASNHFCQIKGSSC